MQAIPEVGGVVFRTDGQQVRILVVRGKKDPTKWVFPKGHVEPEESLAAAVQREVAEETGVKGEVIGPIGAALEFWSGGEPVRVQYFLVRMIADGASPEGREKEWLTPENTLTRLSFDDTRQLLREALAEVERHANTVREGSNADGFAQLLLAEYAHVAESLLRNEEDGEKRVTFFITLAGAAGAALGFMVGGEGVRFPSERNPLVIVTLLVLFAVGYLTFARVVSRNVTTDHYKRGLARIRRYFLRGRDDTRLRFLPFDPYRSKSRSLWSWRGIVKGGWLETIAMMEALIAGACVAALAAAPSWWLNAGLGFVGFVVSWFLLIKNGNARYRRAMWDARQSLVVEPKALGELDERDPRSRVRLERNARRRINRLRFIAKIEEEESGKHYKPHYHPTDEVLFLIEGELRFIDVREDETVTVHPGDALFIPEGLIHQVECVNHARYLMGLRRDVPERDSCGT